MFVILIADDDGPILLLLFIDLWLGRGLCLYSAVRFDAEWLKSVGLNSTIWFV